MSGGAVVFMLGSWGFALGLLGWAYARILRSRAHFDPDGIGPAAPPVPGAADDRR